MKKSDINILGWILPIMLIALMFVIGIIIGSNHTNKKLREENTALQIEIVEYRINEQWFEDYIDLIEEIHNREIEIAEYKITKQCVEDYLDLIEEKRDNVTAPIIDDFEQVIDLCCYYYEETDKLVSFGDWLQINYPELYSRLLNYF